jgi:hypothetical protein
MANTTNYNWETPDDTDLVKDGAAAIRTLGSSVDTTTKALNPSTTLGDIEYRSSTANTNTRLGIGSTGQVLTVAGGVPTWATSDDANAIQNALLTTTGDTIYASGASTPARLGIGSTGQVLTVAGGVPSWATPSAGATFVGCSLSKSANQSIANGTFTALTFDVEQFDTNTFHDNATNNTRITAPTGKGGYYQVDASIQWPDNTTSVRYAAIYKNGVDYFRKSMSATYSSFGRLNIPLNIAMPLAAGDYIEVYVYQASGGALNVVWDADGPLCTNFGVSYLGA